jgi:hypothetical protein
LQGNLRTGDGSQLLKEKELCDRRAPLIQEIRWDVAHCGSIMAKGASFKLLHFIQILLDAKIKGAEIRDLSFFGKTLVYVFLLGHTEFYKVFCFTPREGKTGISE